MAFGIRSVPPGRWPTQVSDLPKVLSSRLAMRPIHSPAVALFDHFASGSAPAAILPLAVKVSMVCFAAL